MNRSLQNLIDSIKSANWKLILETSFWLTAMHVCCIVTHSTGAALLTSAVILTLLLRFLDAHDAPFLARTTSGRPGFGRMGQRRLNARA